MLIAGVRLCQPIFPEGVYPCSTYRANKSFQEIFAQQCQGHGLGEESHIWSSLYGGIIAHIKMGGRKIAQTAEVEGV